MDGWSIRVKSLCKTAVSDFKFSYRMTHIHRCCHGNQIRSSRRDIHKTNKWSYVEDNVCSMNWMTRNSIFWKSWHITKMFSHLLKLNSRHIEKCEMQWMLTGTNCSDAFWCCTSTLHVQKELFCMVSTACFRHGTKEQHRNKEVFQSRTIKYIEIKVVGGNVRWLAFHLAEISVILQKPWNENTIERHNCDW